MKNSYKLGLAATAASLALVGCGGSSDSSSAIGTSFYIDEAVGGLNYTCGTQEGITKVDGEFTFDIGSGCTFYLGTNPLRTVEVGELVDGAELYEEDNETSSILIGLDVDGDPSNGITINPDIVAAMEEANISAITDPETDIEQVKTFIAANGGTYVTLEEAQAHLDQTLTDAKAALTTLVSDNVLTFTSQTAAGVTLVATFNADGSYFEESDGETCSGEWAAIDHTMIGATCTNPTSTAVPTSFDTSDIVFEFIGELQDGVTTVISAGEPTKDEFIGTSTIQSLVEVEAAEAEAQELRLLLAGKTLYAENNYEAWTFNDTVTSVYIIDADAGTDTVGRTMDITLEGTTITADGGATTMVCQIQETDIKLTINNSTVDNLWFNLADLDNALVIAVTEDKLIGKTFYHYQPGTQYENEIYSKMTLSGGIMTRTEVVNGAADAPFEIPYTIIEGKVRINVPAMDGDPATYIWWTLGEETADFWTVKDEEDQNQDGSIEATDYLTLYLSKPTDYPATL